MAPSIRSNDKIIVIAKLIAKIIFTGKKIEIESYFGISFQYLEILPIHVGNVSIKIVRYRKSVVKIMIIVIIDKICNKTK